MKSTHWSIAGLILTLVPSLVAAQEPTRAATDVITAIGCVEREADYRAQTADGKGGVAGSGVGVSNEFVLRSVRTVSSATLKPIRTGDEGQEMIYSLTGNLEKEVAQAAGAQIAVSGFVEVAPSEGTNKVQDLPRFNVVGWHKVSDRCQMAGAHK